MQTRSTKWEPSFFFSLQSEIKNWRNMSFNRRSNDEEADWKKGNAWMNEWLAVCTQLPEKKLNL